MEEYDLQEFINALHIRRKWNKLDPDKFIELFIDYYKPEDIEDTKENMKKGLSFYGLLNSDFIPLKVEKF
jgi:hypothetical protein